MTRSELQQLILTRLVREHGGSLQSWRRVLGIVRVYSVATHPHCNWEVAPSGATADVQAVELLVDTLRHEHPHVAKD